MSNTSTGSTTTRLNLLDAAMYNIERPEEPWGVHLELRTEGQIDPERLEWAIRSAASKHPIARARLIPPRPHHTRYHWHIADRLDHAPLTVVRVDDEVEAAAARERQLRVLVPLTQPGPFTVTLLHRKDGTGDSIVLNLNHSAGDGMSAYRLLTSISRAYAGIADPEPAVDPLAVRDLWRLAGAKNAKALAMRAWSIVLMVVRGIVAAPARIAPRGGHRHAYGYGVVNVALSPEDTAAVAERRIKPGTVNDVVLAATVLTIDRWNADHGAKRRRTTVMMPVNMRPAHWWTDVVGNFSPFVSISVAKAALLDFDSALAAVTRETQLVKKRATAGLLFDLLMLARPLPSALKGWLRTLTLILSRSVVDTIWVSNLGRLDRPEKFGGAGQVQDLMFSPPVNTPMGMAIGVATVDGRMNLTIRYVRTMFDDAAAAEFGDRLRATLLQSALEAADPAARVAA